MKTIISSVNDLTHHAIKRADDRVLANQSIRNLVTRRLLLSIFVFCICFSLTTHRAFAYDATTHAEPDLSCAGDRYGSALNCTAGEFTVDPVFSASEDTVPFCVAGESFEFLIDLRLYGTNTDRYDVGFFVGQDGNNPWEVTGTNNCSVAIFPETPYPWGDLDANRNDCGDYYGYGDSVTRIDKIKVNCTGDASGYLQVPYVVTYWQNTTSTCTDEWTVSSPSKSKCNSGISTVSGDVKVMSGAYVDVTKVTTPSGDSEIFELGATGPTGSTVISRVGTVYTPADIDLATNSTAAYVADGQTARFFINALATDQTLTITETDPAPSWESEVSISCSDVAGLGSPTVTTNDTTRTITATLNTTDLAQACTLTNTKRPKITLRKVLNGRTVSADQFTVSATSNATLYGTTSASTSGTLPETVETTFYSAPYLSGTTAPTITITDALSAGTSQLSDYESRLTCTNAYAGGTTGLPSDALQTSYSFDPVPGDDITCTFTNSPKVQLSKIFDPTPVGIGQPSALTFTLTNPGSATARSAGLTFSDTLPAGVVIADPANVVNNCGGTPTITATPGSSSFTVGGTGVAAAAGTSSCTISVDVLSETAGAYINGSTNISAYASAIRNDVTDQTLTVVQPSLDKEFSTTTIVERETSTLTFTLTNGTGDPAQAGINFTDTLPTNVFVAVSPNIATSCSPGTGIITAAAGGSTIAVSGASMNDGQGSCTISVDVTSAVPGGPYNNTSANISGEYHIVNAVTTSGLTVLAMPEITVLKQSNNNTGSFSFSGTNGVGSFSLDTNAANPQTSATFEATTVTTATDISETLPSADWLLVSADCTDGSNTFGTLTGTTLTIPAAYVAYNAEIFCTFINRYLAADLAIAKAVNNVIPRAGQNVIFTLTVTNNGPDSTDGVSVSDLLPTGFSYVSDDGGGNYVSTTGVWTIGTLANGASATLNITATVNDRDVATVDSDYTNNADVSGNRYDYDSSNNSDSAYVNPPSPLLSITKSADKSSVDPGEVISYSVRVTNTGTGAATTVVVDDDMSPYTAWSLDAFGSGVPFALTQLATGTPADSGVALGTATYYDETDTAITPVSDGDGAGSGYDGRVKRFELTLPGTMVLDGQFRLEYKVKVK
ncbi:MAG: hypothetical protein C0622_08620 [Desulfuromonas sp.]|nr:MAG: hypothetical protein C0622_08620 [Desulfuromonas sp.]